MVRALDPDACPVLLINHMTVTARQSLAARLAGARVRSDEMFALVSAAGLYERPIAERHRLIFYRGHLEAFDWNLLANATGAPAFAPRLDRLFAFGIDPVDGNLPTDSPEDWPRIAEVASYRERARRAVDELLQRSAVADTRLWHVAIEHRLMHAETLAYLIHTLPYEMKQPPGRIDPPAGATRPAPAPRLIAIPEGMATLGMPGGGEDAFGWDNELGASIHCVPEFAIQSHKVSNGQFLEFVMAGCYQEPSLWPPDDWEWIRQAGVTHPRFWIAGADGWRWRGMFAEAPLPLDHPVYVSHAEASAYARWMKMTLPSEAQYHRAAFGAPSGMERAYPWGDQLPEEAVPARGNFDFARWGPVPVDGNPAGDSAFGVSDLMGNGWEWTSTLFAPFEGFQPFPFYPGYSADFFDGKHYVMKGGSPRTAACLLRRSFRNWFQPHYPYAYASFRCVAG
jgi:iron(II)-dependent oxidoreductase